VAHPQTDGGRITNAPSSFLFRNEAARYGANETDSSSFAATNGKRQRFNLHTSSLFLIQNAAAAIAASHREEEEEEQTPKGSGRGEAASTGRSTGREREREGSSSVTKASGKSSQGREAGRTAGHRMAG
jgi:hypothetical protein